MSNGRYVKRALRLFKRLTNRQCPTVFHCHRLLSSPAFQSLIIRCMNDTDPGTAARVWRSPLSSTTPSTGIPDRLPRRRRAPRSCLDLSRYSRDPRDRSTLRAFPGRESTYERRPSAPCGGPPPVVTRLLQMIVVRLLLPVRRFTFVCPSCCFCLSL